MKKYKTSLFTLIFVAFAAIATFTLMLNNEPAPLEFKDLKGISVISPAVPLPQTMLTDQNGQAFDTDNFRGKWSLLFFGYTHCPDICPTTLRTLTSVADKLADAAPQTIFVTLDPKRDTADKIKDYIHYFSPNFIGLSGEKAEIDKLSQTLGIIYDYEGNDEDYVVNHYTAILVVDPQARLRAHILPPHPVDKVTKAFSSIRDYYGN